jgi:hypothetical protein
MEVHVLIEWSKPARVIGVFSSPEKADELYPITERKFTCVYQTMEFELDKPNPNVDWLRKFVESRQSEDIVKSIYMAK